MEAFDLRYMPDEIALDQELSARGYREFIPIAWPWVEPSKEFKHNWHIDAVADHLQAVVDGEIKRLVICEPPGTSKSITVSVMFPAWVWTIKPGHRFIYGSYNDDLSLRDAKRCRRLIDSDWYQARWGHVFKPHWKDNWEAGRFSNDKGGSRKTTSIAGGVTGEHADIQVADDPHKPFDLTGSLSIAEKSKATVSEWWRSTMATRSTDIKTTARIIIMQRLAHDDLAGEMIESGLYEALVLPMEFEPKRKCFTSIGFEDPRTEEGELLDPDRFPREHVDNLKIELGARAVSAQLQQDPAPKEGTLFKTKHFRNRYKTIDTTLATVIQSWDCTFSDTGNSYVCGQLWAQLNDRVFLVDLIRKQMRFTETVRAIKGMISDWPEAYVKLIEKKANGDAVIDSLENEGIMGLVPIVPKESKAARANAVEPLFETGKVWLPDESIAPWIVEYEKEMLQFTGDKSEVNDQVDATTQALMYFMRHSNERVKQAYSNMAEFAEYM